MLQTATSGAELLPSWLRAAHVLVTVANITADASTDVLCRSEGVYLQVGPTSLLLSHFHSPTAQSSWCTPTCMLPLAYSLLHIPTGAVPRADTSHQLVCAERHALTRAAEANRCRTMSLNMLVL